MLRSAVIGLGDIGPVHVKAIKGAARRLSLRQYAILTRLCALRIRNFLFSPTTGKCWRPSILTASISVCPTIFIIQRLWMPPGQAAHVLTEKPLAMNIEEAKKIHGTGIHIPSQGWGLLSKQAESHDSGAAERTPGSCQRRRYRNLWFCCLDQEQGLL